MASVEKTVDKIINETDYATLGFGATTTLANCTRIDLTKATQCILAIRCDTVPASVDLTIELYPSDDGSTFDDQAWTSPTGWSWTTTAAAENEHSPEIPPLPKYLKVKVTNNHGSSDVTNLRVWAIVQKLG